MRLFCRCHDLFFACVRLGQADIVAHGGIFQPCILQDHAVLMAQAPARDGADIAAVDRDRAILHIVKTHEKIDERRLAAACRADDGDTLARLHGKAQILDEPLLRRVGERDVLQRHAARGLRQRLRVRRVGRLGGLVDEREDPVRARQRVLKLGDNAGDLVERLGVLVRVTEEARQRTHRDRARRRADCARKADARIDDIVDDARGGVRHGREERRAHRGRREAAVDLVELPLALALVRERLYDAHAAQLLVDKGGLFAAGLRLQLEHGIRPRGDELRHQQRQGCQQHHDQRDLPADGQHESERARDGQNAGEQLCEAHEKTVGELVDVGNDAAERIARGMAVKVRERQPLQMRERLSPQIARDGKAHAVVDRGHDPLRQRRQRREDGDTHADGADRGKIDLSRADDPVDRAANEDRDIERARDAGRSQHERRDQKRQILPEAFEHARERFG